MPEWKWYFEVSGRNRGLWGPESRRVRPLTRGSKEKTGGVDGR